MNVPKHIAIIMDGNGRWAQGRGLPRFKGHEAGGEKVEEVISFAPKYGVKHVTFYAFSKENWQRPKKEVAFLMDLLANYLGYKVKKMHDNNVVFNVIGNTKDLPEKIQKKIVEGMDLTRRNTGITATFGLSYSSRQEITRACQKIAEEVKAGKLDPKNITEEDISKNLYTHDLPDPDLLIRTSGEMRISNFLLWQISYTELYITDKLWPEFTEEDFAKAIQEYQKRERRFGKTSAAVSN